MDYSLKETLQYMITLVLCSMFLYSFTHIIGNFNQYHFDGLEGEEISLRYDLLTVEIEPIVLKVNSSFDLYEYIDTNLGTIDIYHNINITELGMYQARYVIDNSYDKIVEVMVVDEDIS